MTPAELRAARARLGLSQLALGRALGYSGADQSVKTIIWRFETGRKTMTPRVEMAVDALELRATPPPDRPG